MKLTKDTYIYTDGDGEESDMFLDDLPDDVFKQIMNNQEYKEMFEHHMDRVFLEDRFESVSVSKEGFNILKEKAEKYQALEEELDVKSSSCHKWLDESIALGKENKRIKEEIKIARNTIGSHYRDWEKLKNVIDEITVVSNLWCEPYASALKKLLVIQEEGK